MSGDLDFAAERVEALTDDLELSQETTTKAVQLAERADLEYPLNHTPRVTAASAVYLAALLTNEKRTQAAVSEVADVHHTSIRECYRKLAEFEGIPVRRRERESVEVDRSRRERVARWLCGVIGV